MAQSLRLHEYRCAIIDLRTLTTRIGAAPTRARIASPVVTAAAVMGTLAEGRVDIAGVSDGSQVATCSTSGAGTRARAGRGCCWPRCRGGKPSTQYRPDAVHDYMHAKVTVADERGFLGSFNLSRSACHDARLAGRMAGFIDGVRARHPRIGVPENL